MLLQSSEIGENATSFIEVIKALTEFDLQQHKRRKKKTLHSISLFNMFGNSVTRAQLKPIKKQSGRNKTHQEPLFQRVTTTKQRTEREMRRIYAVE